MILSKLQKVSVMKFKQPIIALAILCCLCNIYACSSEPTTTEECINKYIGGVKNDNAAKAIEQACSEIFDGNKTDDEYHKCVLDDVYKAKTDKEVNSILRRCTMSKY